MSDKTATWAEAPTEDDLADAAAFLTLLSVPGVDLEDLGQVFYPAKDLLRAALLAPLPQSNAGVTKWAKRIKAGQTVPPVLLLRGDLSLDLPLVIAEGYHRVSACYQLDEQTPVAGHFLTPG